MRHALAVVVASGVVVCQLEPEPQALVRIHGELRVEPVLTMQLVAAVVVGQIGERREGVGIQKLVGVNHKERVGVGEDERAALLTVDEDTVLSGGIVVADSVVLAISA